MGDAETTAQTLAQDWLNGIKEDLASETRRVTIDDWIKDMRALKGLDNTTEAPKQA